MPYKDPEKAKAAARRNTLAWRARNLEAARTKALERYYEKAKDPEWRKAQNEKGKLRRHANIEEYRKNHNKENRKYYARVKASDPEGAKARNREKRRKRLTDPVYRAAFNDTRRAKYAQDENYRKELKAKAKQFRKDNPDKIRAWNRIIKFNRRALIGCSKPVTHDEWQAVLNYYGNACAYCGKAMEVVTMDHIIAVARGGLHEPYNLAPACGHCNSSKKNATLIEFLFLRELRAKQRILARITPPVIALAG